MIRMIIQADPTETCYHGLRMSAAQYLSLPESDSRYELIDGVVLMTPSPTPLHQKIVTRIAHWIANHLDQHPAGEVYVEVDVNLGAGHGRDLVYRPDVVYLRRERVDESKTRIDGPPDLVVEVVSPDSRKYDSITKKHDYERCGVPEYWVIDPFQETVTLYTREGENFAEIPPEGGRLASRVLPGFVLQLERILQVCQTG